MADKTPLAPLPPAATMQTAPSMDGAMSMVELGKFESVVGGNAQTEAAKWVQEAIAELGPSKASTYIMRGDYLQRVEAHRPEEFTKIRKNASCDKLYIEEIKNGQLQEAPAWKARGWARLTASGRFFLQLVPTKGAEFLKENLDKFVHHFETQPLSFINRFCGLYNVGHLYPNELTSDRNCYIVVTRNMFPQQGRPMDYMYRLKGLDRERSLKRRGEQHQVLREGNFVEEQQVIMLPKVALEKVDQALVDDSKLLEALGSVNYTLALGIRKLNENKENKEGEPDKHLQESCQVGWRMNQERVEYHFWIIDTLVRYHRTVRERIMKPSMYRPDRYRLMWRVFIEDRLFPIQDESELKWEAMALKGRAGKAKHRSHASAPVNTLTLLSYSEWEDRNGATLEDVGRWRALIDVLESGPLAIALWRDLGLVEIGFEEMLPVLRADMERRPLPEFVGNVEKEAMPTGIAQNRINKFVELRGADRAAKTVGGDPVTASSTQYTLSYAISVGVETATKCSAKVAERTKKIFKRHTELRRRPAAHRAKRSFFLPEAGSWLSPPHFIPDLNFVEHAPEIFKEVRNSVGFDDLSYINCVCPRDFSFIEFKSNSKSGEFFFFTHDGRCMVKTVSKREADALIRMLEKGYLEHVSEGSEGSIITRILGLYEVGMPWFNKGQPQYFIVQENLFFGAGHVDMLRFDLKGSTQGRKAKPSESVQKDIDWTQGSYSFKFAATDQMRLKRQHRVDCEFLARCNVIDYSLLVGVIGRQEGKFEKRARRPHLEEQTNLPAMTMMRKENDEGTSKGRAVWDRVRNMIFDSANNKVNERAIAGPREDPHGPHKSGQNGSMFYIGVIDFLIPWNWRKRVEYYYRVLTCNGRSASCNPPKMYADRQVDFLSQFW